MVWPLLYSAFDDLPLAWLERWLGARPWAAGFVAGVERHRLGRLTNHPLLRELLLRAPGTYHHAVRVAGLAGPACAALGGDPALAEVGALFHDVGKLEAPGDYPENATVRAPPDRGDEPARHVEAGLALARRHRLPPSVLAGIATHHAAARGADALPDAPHLVAVCLANRIARRATRAPSPAEAARIVAAVIDDALEDGDLAIFPLPADRRAALTAALVGGLLTPPRVG